MSSAHDPSRYVRAVCPVCKAVLHPRVERAGRHVRCPDCHSAVLVPQPTAPEPPKPRRDPGQYAVVEGQRTTVEPERFSLHCPTCRALLHPRTSYVGKRVRCPDCEVVFVVPPPPPPETPKPRPQPGQYDVGLEPERPEVPLEHLLVQGTLPPEPLSTPPQRWYLSGVFTFPWSAGAAARWGTLALLAVPFGEMLVLVLAMSGVLGSFGGELSYASVLIPTLIVPTAWLGFWTLSYAAACFLPIVQDTAAGNDAIVSWSDMDWRERAAPLLYLAYQSTIAAAAGAAIGWPIGFFLDPGWGKLTALLLAVTVFPFTLLSALEADSPFVPYSPLILRSLLKVWWAWLIVYIELLGVVGGALALTAAGLAWSPFVAVLFAAPLWSAAAFIAARLIGRLAWRIGEEQAAKKKRRKKKKVSAEAV